MESPEIVFVFDVAVSNEPFSIFSIAACDVMPDKVISVSSSCLTDVVSTVICMVPVSSGCIFFSSGSTVFHS